MTRPRHPAAVNTPANQTDETAGGAIKQPQGNEPAERDIARGSETATGASARRR